MILKKNQLEPAQSWQETDEQEVAYLVYSKEEMEALQKKDPAQFATLSPWRIVAIQMICTALSALAWAFFKTPNWFNLYAESALYGGIIGALPTAVFVLRLESWTKKTHSKPEGFLLALVSGEILKISLTLALFIGLGLWGPRIEWVPLLVTYVLTIKCYWAANFLSK